MHKTAVALVVLVGLILLLLGLTQYATYGPLYAGQQAPTGLILMVFGAIFIVAPLPWGLKR